MNDVSDLTIKKITNIEELPYALLLLADPSRGLVDEYTKNGECYMAINKNGEVVGEYVLLKHSQDLVELKNIAVDEKYQGHGFGKVLVFDAIKNAKDLGAKTIEVGTGNSSFNQLALYQKCGFRITSIDKDFFTKNYPEEIIENGIKCIDMIRLTRNTEL